MRFAAFLPAFLVFFFLSYAGAQDFTVRTIGLSEGLSQSSINAIVQDDQGFLWFATQDGLNRYDGYEFEVMKNEPFDTGSLSHNHITALYFDARGNLWAGTTSGLNVFLPQSRKFRRFFLDSNNPYSISGSQITCFYETAEGVLWVGTNEGLCRMRLNTVNKIATDTFLFERIPIPPSADAPSEKYSPENIILCLSEWKDTLWIGTRNGLFTRSREGKVERYNSGFGSENQNPLTIKALGADSAGHFYLFTNQGNYRRTEASATFESGIFPSRHHPGGVPVHRFLCDRAGNILLATEGYGILRYKPGEEKQWPPPQWMGEEPANMADNWMFDIIEDKLSPGTYWAGTAVGGIRHILKNTRKFYSNPGLEPQLQTFVRSSFIDSRGIVWLGLENGLIRHDEKANTSRVFPQVSEKSRIVYKFFEDSRGQVWLGTENGLFVVSEKGGLRFREIFLPDSLKDRRISEIKEAADGKLWLGTGSSLVLFDPKEDDILAVSHPLDSLFGKGKYGFITDWKMDRKGRLWVSSLSGLVRIDRPEHLFYSSGEDWEIKYFHHNPADVHSLRNESVSNIALDDSGLVWLGTMNGLIRVEENDGQIRFHAFTEKDGLANNVIYALAFDDQTHSLWMSTNRGLTRFDPHAFRADNYDIRDGLQDNEFNQCAIGKSRNGQLIFGGLRGYTRFSPGEITRDKTPPQIWITSFSGGDGQDREMLYYNPEPLKLRYTENTFTIGYTGLNYKNTTQNMYAYRLVLDGDTVAAKWVQTGNSRQASITNLPPGEYTFQVKAANSDGIWSASTADLAIVILPPFWQTWWFYLISLTLLGSLLGSFHIYRLRQKVRRVMELERVRKNTAADFHDELGHKLTIISLFGEILKNQLEGVSEKSLPHLNKMISTSNSLYYSMKDLLWVLDPEKDSFLDMAILLKDFGDELFDKTGVSFVVEGIKDEMSKKILPMELKRHIVLIFKEVMNNSLKHSGCNRAALSMKLEAGETLLISFTDNGSGFDLTEARYGHGLMNVRDRAAKIGALLKIVSDSSGTTITLKVQ
ncbi:MAG: two-component regulator propeller domain-containing protein [Bacteroidia bacterium]